MGLKDRLRRLELKLISNDGVPDQPIELDSCIASLGLLPATVRETARSRGCSLALVTSEILGLEFGEFKRQLQAVVLSGRR